MADLKDILSGTLGTLADKARDFAGSENVKNAVGRIRETAESSGVAGVYAQGAEPVHALDGVSVSIDEGEFVAIMGASGSGKSTMLNILGCLDTPTSGTYLLDGVEVAGRSRKELAHRGHPRHAGRDRCAEGHGGQRERRSGHRGGDRGL